MKQLLFATALVLAGFASLHAQARPTDTLRLSLPQALARANTQSDEIRLAESQLALAHAQIHEVRAGALPQINASVGYTRTFESQFSTSGFTVPDSLKFEPDSLASMSERLRYLEDKAPIAGLGGIGQLFGDLPFGRKNAYAASVTASQLLFSGGRVGAALEAARNYRELAAYELIEQRADIELAVRTAYYRTQFAGELERISELAVEQAGKFLEQEQLREKTGASSELDVLRAEVAAANLQPQLVQARNAAELAALELKRMLNLPPTQPIALTTALEVPAAEVLNAPPAVADEVLQSRAAVAAATRNVRMRELAVSVAKGAFLPQVSISMSYNRLAYPTSIFKLGGNQWRTDWTGLIGVQIPVFDGLRRNAQVDAAQAQLLQARLQLAQLREGVQIQYQQAIGERQRAAAAILARQKTVTQAQRVHDLTVLRYDRGLATQLEVSDARLALLQARTNLAQALSDFYIAEATVDRTIGSKEQPR